MEFGPVDTAMAEGAILAHSCMAGGRKIAKGSLLGGAEIAALQAAGHERVTVARLGPGDTGEDAAATRLARALVPDPDAACVSLAEATRGRVNIHAAGPGLVRVDTAAVHRLNLVDPALTLATLAPYTRVVGGTLVGTVKIIPYAVATESLDAACAAAGGAIGVYPVRHASAGLVLSETPGQAAKLSAKATAVTEARLAALGMELAETRRVAHEPGAIAGALAGIAGDIVLLLTGSATSDIHDTGPEGLRAAGGRVDRFGMPVDPGNLLFLGTLSHRPVIGLPGCARSPALNGADWVLERIACGLFPDSQDIAAMGVGGLLKEIPTRPQPREAPRR
ncbi:molybdopterin biosynthesis protein [Rhodobacteraceae bacterium WD3A24]|nr:molybdopterin biosynthesis protein [Rhodobacteraceae bacterium WD3A24]